jgi:NADPH:quinone reductase-like Zn-dependent oxidoreductase
MFQIFFLGRKKIGMMETASPNENDLIFLNGLLEAGRVVPVVDRTYPLREVAKAIGYLEAGHAQGKVVITMEHTNKA